MLNDAPVTKFDWFWLIFAALGTIAASAFSMNQFGFGIVSCYWTGVAILLFTLPRFGYNGCEWRYEKDSVSDLDRKFLSGIGFFVSFVYPYVFLVALAIVIVMGLVFAIQWIFIPEFRTACKTLKTQFDDQQEQR